MKDGFSIWICFIVERIVWYGEATLRGKSQENEWGKRTQSCRRKEIRRTVSLFYFLFILSWRIFRQITSSFTLVFFFVKSLHHIIWRILFYNSVQRKRILPQITSCHFTITLVWRSEEYLFVKWHQFAIWRIFWCLLKLPTLEND